MTTELATAALLIAVPIAFNLAFFELGRAFDYPNILRKEPDEILRRFAAGGSGLILRWQALLLSALAMLPLVALVALTLNPPAPLAVTSVVVGSAAALVQALGLVRWPFAVPELARRYLAAGDGPDGAATRRTVEVVFPAHVYPSRALARGVPWLALDDRSRLTEVQPVDAEGGHAQRHSRGPPTEVGTDMADFTFIQDDRFRASLEMDYRELATAAEGAAWKAVHVLAGSIVEAVLIDFLVDTPSPSRGKKDPLTLDLGEAIDICHKENVLSDKAAALCHVIRGYRNLIHPGRMRRLSETIDEHSGKVALALTEMIVAEVGRVRAIKVGYTAEQLANKLEGDPTATEILKHLVPRLSKSDLEKLLLKVIPARYEAAMEHQMGDEPYPRALRSAYHSALARADEPLKRQVAAWYTDIVRNGQQRTVHDFQEAFFRAADLGSYDRDDKSLVVDHLLERMRRERSKDIFEAASNIGPHLTKAQARLAVDAAVSEIIHGKDSELDELARFWVWEVYNSAATGIPAAMEARRKAWVDMYNEKSQPDRANSLARLLTGDDELDDLPF